MSNRWMSVAMCTYNGSRFVGEQLQTIASQTHPPDELVICDDGSTDDTLDLLRAFAANAPFPVRIFSNKETLGPAKNFEKAISLCAGEIVALADQDDMWKPEKIASLLEVFERQPGAVYAFSDGEMVEEDERPLGYTVWDAVGFRKKLNRFSGVHQVGILLRHNLIAGSSMAFRASFRDVALPIPSGWMHDYWMVLLGSALFQGAPVSERLYTYRRHASQVCGWKKKTFGHVIRDSIATGQEESWKKVEQFRELQKRIDLVCASVQCPQNRLELLRQKETHLLKRAAARSARGVSRLVGVMAEASTGRYQRFSNSWYSIVRDL